MKAFPHPSLTISDMGQVRAYTVGEGGMDLRDYFAAKAMQAFIIAGVTPAEGFTKKQAVVSMAFETADEMMEARNEQVR